MNKLPTLPYNRQCLDEADIESVLESLNNPFLTTGPEANDFEKEIAEYVDAKYAVVCSNGTAALHLSMLALNIKPGDCVLTTPITFVADANAARFVGADVTFSDIDRSTANMNMNRLEESLESHSDIRVVIPVHFAGRPVEMERLAEIAEKYNVSVVEDGCHALGSLYQTKDGKKMRVGSCKHSTMTVFSFHPIKSITTGEGGAITTNDREIYERLLQLRNHSITRDPSKIINRKNAFTKIDGEQKFNPWYYEMQDLSPNYRITDFQCALGRSQLRKLDGFIKRRNTLVKIYEQALAKRLSDLVIPLKRTNGIIHAQHLFVVRIPFHQFKGGRVTLMNFLLEHGVQTQVHYIPIHMHPYYQNYLSDAPYLPEAEQYYQECLSLPLFPSMKDTDPEIVVGLLEMAFSNSILSKQ